MSNNILYYGDNLDILRRYIKDESVDLIYLDPPFKSGQDYNVLFAEKNGSKSHAQIQAFEDTWTWDMAAAAAYQDVVETGPTPVAKAMQAFRMLLGENDMLAYLSMMAPRLVQLKRALRTTGSIYLHCDSTASAHLRILMDAVFGTVNFRNEIIWYYYNKMHDRRKKLFPRANDTILFYAKDVSSDFTFKQLKEPRPKAIKQLARRKVDGRMVNVKDAQGRLVYRLRSDRTLDNVWRIPCLQPAASERLGYPTQKPEALLERIISAGSNEGDNVLDPFCGCGTTIAVAERLKRRWIGIDITRLAIALIKHRLRDAFGRNVSYKVIGEPVGVSEAEALAKEDPYQFQWWALGLVGARPVEQKKGSDKGIDGRLYFHDEAGKKARTKQIILQVKAGSATVAHVRDLRGVMDRENAEIGALICLEEPTQAMRGEAASAGFYKSAYGRFPRLQIRTIKEIMLGKGIEYPSPGETNVTFKRAPKAKRKDADQLHFC